jgi:hypothetical protein
VVDVSSLEVGYAPATALASEVDSTVFHRLEYDVPRYAEVVTLGLHEVFLRCRTSTLGHTRSDLVGFLLMNDAPAHAPDCPINETAEGYDRSAPYTALSWFGKTDENLMPAEKIFRDHKNRLLIGGRHD